MASRSNTDFFELGPVSRHVDLGRGGRNELLEIYQRNVCICYHTRADEVGPLKRPKGRR